MTASASLPPEARTRPTADAIFQAGGVLIEKTNTFIGNEKDVYMNSKRGTLHAG